MTDQSITSQSGDNRNLTNFLIRLGILIALDIFLGWFIYQQAIVGNFISVTVISVVAIMLTFIILFDRAYPLRWMAAGLAMLIIFSIYPTVLTIYIAFTNYGTGHLVTEVQAINQLEGRRFTIEGEEPYKWTAFQSDDGDYALWLLDAEGNASLAFIGEFIEEAQVGQNGVGQLDDKGIPTSISGYTRLNAIQASTNPELMSLEFGDPSGIIYITSTSQAARQLQEYVYDEVNDSVLNQQTGVAYYNLDGTYTSNTGEELQPGFRTEIGWENFKEFLLSPAFRGPMFTILSWNFIYPTLAVLTQFGLGLFIAMLFNGKDYLGKKIIRSILILPQTIPSLITILIWRGMFNGEVGVINRILTASFGIAPEWFAEPWLARFVIVFVSLWLGYPYFMLISSGALQAIPTEIYQAAEVDGATPWQKFRKITLPLLLVSVGPLLLASYIMNFNNFNLMFLLGGPPIAGSPTPATYTDILLSYVYKMAFEGGRGTRYGLASAITIGIFLFVGIFTLIQFRYTSMWEEVSENV